MQGFLESERLMKETLQKENIQVHQMKQATELELHRKLKEAVELTKMMDADILLLQKSNEETEAQLASSQPELHAIKLKLIEANNTIARYKAQLGIKWAVIWNKQQLKVASINVYVPHPEIKTSKHHTLSIMDHTDP